LAPALQKLWGGPVIFYGRAEVSVQTEAIDAFLGGPQALRLPRHDCSAMSFTAF
jgi:hypothetical protein